MLPAPPVVEICPPGTIGNDRMNHIRKPYPMSVFDSLRGILELPGQLDFLDQRERKETW